MRRNFQRIWMPCLLLLIAFPVGIVGQETQPAQPAVPGVTPNQDDASQTPNKNTLWKAARENDFESVKQALRAGVDVDSKTDYGSTALFYACDRGNLEIVQFLLENGADPNIKDTFYKASPMTWAQSKGGHEIVILLLKNGAEGADRILLSAVMSGDVAFVEEILETKQVQPAGLIAARDAALDLKSQVKSKQLQATFAKLKLPAPVVAENPNPKPAEKSDDEPTTDPPAAAAATKASPANAILHKPNAGDLAVSSVNWPGFRGNGSRGVADGQNPPLQWHVNRPDENDDPADDTPPDSTDEQPDAEPTKNLKWESPVPGLGLSCPTIWADKIFLTSAVAEGQDANLKIGLYGDVASVVEDQEYEFKLLCYSKTD